MPKQTSNQAFKRGLQPARMPRPKARSFVPRANKHTSVLPCKEHPGALNEFSPRDSLQGERPGSPRLSQGRRNRFGRIRSYVWSTGRLTRSPSSALLPTFLGEGSPTKIDYRKNIPKFSTSLLEHLVNLQGVPTLKPDFGAASRILAKAAASCGGFTRALLVTLHDSRHAKARRSFLQSMRDPIVLNENHETNQLQGFSGAFSSVSLKCEGYVHFCFSFVSIHLPAPSSFER